MKNVSLSYSLLLIAQACTFDPSTKKLPTADSDASVPVDAAKTCLDWKPAHFSPCDLPPPLAELRLTAAGSPWQYDTDTGLLSDGGGTTSTPSNLIYTQNENTDLRIVSTDRIIVDSGAVLRIRGSLPLLLAAFQDIDMAGTIDASSTRNGGTGAGASPSSCTAIGAQSGEDGQGGSGGGGGGGFQGTGGAGGQGDANASDFTPRLGGVGGMASASPAIVVGGCPGADSGVGVNAGLGQGGDGGGAVQLSAFRSILLSGTITAGGAGGGGGDDGSGSGGGGGGAGGYVGLEASTIETAASILTANGGGGGQGCSYGSAGADGEDGQASASRASGGASSSCGTSGGDGSAGPILDGDTQPGIDNCGGGGGGGAAGFVLVRTPNHNDSGLLSSPVALVTAP